MIKTIQILVVLFLMSTTVSYSQVSGENEMESSPLSEVFVLLGGATGISTAVNLSDFKRMAPSSLLLKEDLTDFNSLPSNEWNSHQYFGVMVGFVPGKKSRTAKKYSPLVRLGVSYESGEYFDNYFSKSTSFRFDTLYNSQGQSVYYRDSVKFNETNMYYSSSSLSVEGSILLRTNTARRWMFYVGVGFSGGFSFRNEVNVSKTITDFMDEYEVTSSSNNSSVSSINDRDLQVEVRDVGSSWVLSGFVPLGIDFRLGKKNEFLKQIHLFVEFRPGIKMMDIPSFGVNTSSYTLSSFGLRYVWN